MMLTAVTAEWLCTRCGATNRKLVPVRIRKATDRCVTCHAKHVLQPAARPVRWEARLEE